MAFKPQKIRFRNGIKAFKTRKQLEDAVNGYFDNMDDEKRPYSIAGLAYYLGCCRFTIYNYEHDKEFGDIITRARDRCIMTLEEKMMEKGTAGQIFLAKNYGYTDRQDIVNHDSKEIDKELDEFKDLLYDEN